MAKTFAGTARVSLTGTMDNTVDLGNIAYNLSYAQSISITNGTGANQANMIFTDTRTLTASSSEDLDLAGGLTDAYGAAITFTKIKGIIVSASSNNTNNVIVGGDGSAAFVNWVGDATDTIVVRPGGTFALFAPDSTAYAVTATTGDILQIANSAGSTSVTYDIIILGTV